MTNPDARDQPTDQSAWAALTPGTIVAVAKLTPEGSEAARYSGVVVRRRDPDRWAIVRATWTNRQVDFDGLSFVPGDLLLEWFSPDVPFNAFAIFSPQGIFRGWYANVAYPARLPQGTSDDADPALLWQDLYLDLVGFPDGRWVLRDEDELRVAGLGEADPELLARIETAAAELQRRFIAAEMPFVDQGEMHAMLGFSEAHSIRH
jgi:hypothetical protein